ncbi:MAG TPA: hypothetical protein PKD78_16160, partial [Saprospiraceae bacterium]|nr:hypothetical protein [Saprospiraceae bacterium]
PDPKIHYPKFNELLVQNTEELAKKQVARLSAASAGSAKSVLPLGRSFSETPRVPKLVFCRR